MVVSVLRFALSSGAGGRSARDPSERAKSAASLPVLRSRSSPCLWAARPEPSRWPRGTRRPRRGRPPMPRLASSRQIGEERPSPSQSCRWWRSTHAPCAPALLCSGGAEPVTHAASWLTSASCSICRYESQGSRAKGPRKYSKLLTSEPERVIIVSTSVGIVTVAAASAPSIGVQNVQKSPHNLSREVQRMLTVAWRRQIEPMVSPTATATPRPARASPGHWAAGGPRSQVVEAAPQGAIYVAASS